MTLTARTVLTVLLALCLASAAEAARRQHGEDDDPTTARAKIHLESGVAYFNEGKFADAEREMTQAYALRPVPELKYNLGQCQERIGAFDRAAASYRDYLKGRPQAQDRAAVEQRITQIEEQLRRQPEVEPPPGPAAAPAAPPVAASGAVAPAALTATQPPLEKVVFKEIVVYKEKPPKAGRTARIIGYSLLGLVAVGLAAGVVFSVTASNTKQNIDAAKDSFDKKFQSDLNMCPTDIEGLKAKVAMQLMRPSDDGAVSTITEGFCGYNKAAQEALKQNIGSAGISFGLAALSAVGATGTLLYARHLDKKQEREQEKKSRLPNLSLAPTFGPASGGLVLVGEF